jgi:hypothetical protein
MNKRQWWNRYKRSATRVSRSLENRIVLCADCDTNRLLTVTSLGTAVCSHCGSEHWMHVSVPLAARFKRYNDEEAKERAAVDRYLRMLEKEEFFSSICTPV